MKQMKGPFVHFQNSKRRIISKLSQFALVTGTSYRTLLSIDFASMTFELQANYLRGFIEE